MRRPIGFAKCRERLLRRFRRPVLRSTQDKGPMRRLKRSTGLLQCPRHRFRSRTIWAKFRGFAAEIESRPSSSKDTFLKCARSETLERGSRSLPATNDEQLPQKTTSGRSGMQSFRSCRSSEVTEFERHAFPGRAASTRRRSKCIQHSESNTPILKHSSAPILQTSASTAPLPPRSAQQTEPRR